MQGAVLLQLRLGPDRCPNPSWVIASLPRFWADTILEWVSGMESLGVLRRRSKTWPFLLTTPHLHAKNSGPDLSSREKEREWGIWQWLQADI